MAYVPVPKDLTKVKSKFAFNLTKRQILFFGLVAAVGLPLFFLLKGATDTTVAALLTKQRSSLEKRNNICYNYHVVIVWVFQAYMHTKGGSYRCWFYRYS